jgi:SPOR domain/PilZ domain
LSDAFQAVSNPETSERRFHPRRQVLFSRVQLENDNGGIVLNVSERGLAMRVVRSLPNDSLSEMRFQLSQSNTWIETRARITWIDASKTTAGVEFVGLPYAGQIRLKRWIASLVQSGAPVKEGQLAKNIEVERSPVLLQSEAAVPVPESKVAGFITEDQSQSVTAEDPPAVLHSPAENRGAETVSEGPAAEILELPAAENSGYRIGSPIALFYGKQYSREIGSRERTIGSRKSARWIRLSLAAVLLLSALGYLAFHLRMITRSRQTPELTVSARVLELPENNSTGPAKPSADSRPPSIGKSFVLQVGAMTHKDNADRLAESLRKKNFPAFVSHNTTDRFYYVIVGPYPDVHSTSTAREALKKENVDAIREQSNPASVQNSIQSHQ